MTNVQRSRRQVRLSRALGIALTPKAQRIFEKRPYAPGEHGRDPPPHRVRLRGASAPKSSVCALGPRHLREAASRRLREGHPHRRPDR